MNVLAQEQVQRWIKSKLQGFFLLRVCNTATRFLSQNTLL